MRWYEDTSYILMCNKAREIQLEGSYNKYGDLKKYKQYQILDKMNYYASYEDGRYYYIPNFGIDYVSNFTVGGYVRIPEQRFGCAVRDDLHLAYKPEQITWLPCQEQLQSMIFTDIEDTINIQLAKIYLFAFSEYKPYNTPFALFGSMEQLWLAFVMKDKYNKVWNGKDWI